MTDDARKMRAFMDMADRHMVWNACVCGRAFLCGPSCPYTEADRTWLRAQYQLARTAEERGERA